MTVTSTRIFKEAGSILDIKAIDGAQYFLGANEGLFKTSKDQLINHYHRGKSVRSLYHVNDSLYLVGFFASDGLILWNEQTDRQLSKICDNTVFSIERVIATDTFIIKKEKGVELLTINDLESLQFSMQHLLDAKEYRNLSDSLKFQVAHSQITIATT